MIKYDPATSLADYEALCDELCKDISRVKRQRFFSNILKVFLYVCFLLSAIIIISLFSFIPSRWLFVPLIVVAVYLCFSLPLFSKKRENLVSLFLNYDYNADIIELKSDIRDAEYYIRCLKKGEEIDPTRCYISVD
ncbi:MAG: hypothetical protein J6J01_10830 [Oscillospiraceae bacterium]|nr:hypothetical protein [Oscillospiraceae bacterium]